jgi:N,N'-diacetyllegionaminate synthase
MRKVKIGNRLVGPDEAVFVIAEAGVNHNGDMAIARDLIRAAAKVGADAVKFQSFVTEDLIMPDAPKADYQVVTTGEPGGQYSMLKALELNSDQQAELKAYCHEIGILYLCTPYEITSVDALDGLDVAAFKIASTDTTNIPFLRYVGKKQRPVILSTGWSTLGEVEQAIAALNDSGQQDEIVILQCTGEYPAPIEDANLRTMQTMEQAFGYPTGFSDHTPGIGASPWAVAAGARMIEKHFTLDRKMSGPDHRTSLEPDEFAELVQTVRSIELAIGDGIKRPMPSEIGNKYRMQKSLVAKCAVKTGELIHAEDLVCKRPGNGLVPNWFDRVVGRRAAKDIQPDEMLTLQSIDWSD